ncbi:methyltransferase-like protein 27 [Gasterosteus aculeatus]
MCYRAPHLAVDFLSSSFSGSRGAARVLDVACGSGLVAMLMLELGFKHFVGVDGSQGMLDQAAKTGIYEELRLALLGAEPLPAKIGAFDVVIMVGALDPGFAPVSVVRELCQAAKPGGLVCMSRGDHSGPAGREYKKDLEAELQLMEEEDLEEVESSRTQTHQQIHEGPSSEARGDPAAAAGGVLPKWDCLSLQEAQPLKQRLNQRAEVAHGFRYENIIQYREMLWKNIVLCRLFCGCSLNLVYFECVYNFNLKCKMVEA